MFPAENISSENYSYDAIISPQVSLLYKPGSLKTIYVSFSHGFSLPSVEETLTANGTINSSIKPENGFNVELGGKFYLVDKHLYVEMALFRMQIKDLLVAKRINDDQYVGVNAGETLHQGIETEIHFNKNISQRLFFNVYVSASFGKYEFEDFDDNGNDFSGNELTGVPDSKCNAGFTFSGKSGWYISADYQFTDKIPINDANSVYSDAYRLVDLKTGWKLEIFRQATVHFSAGVNNVFDEHYASMVLVNAAAVGTALPRYYYPGMPVNFYGNFSFTYDF
jgi:iron complex outermembrane receptor protein